MLRDDLHEYLIAPDPKRRGLTRSVEGVDETDKSGRIAVIEERPLTIFLNGQEIVTAGQMKLRDGVPINIDNSVAVSASTTPDPPES